MTTVFGPCAQCGGFPINDRTDLCEACEEEAYASGELLDEEDDSQDEEDC